jgi:hypothetical protein
VTDGFLAAVEGIFQPAFDVGPEIGKEMQIGALKL